MASEDSEEIRPGPLAIHRLRDLNDVSQPLRGEVMAGVDERDALRELPEVASLRRDEGIRLGERNDR